MSVLCDNSALPSRFAFKMFHDLFDLQFKIFQRQSLIEFLQQQLISVVDEDFQQWIAQNRIWLDGEQVTDDALLLQPGQLLVVQLKDHYEAETNTNWQLLWQNDQLMVVDKPANLPVSRTTRNLFNTLIQLIRRQTPYRDAHLLHRLDAETGGLMVIAKDKKADKRYKPKIKKLITRKIYRAKVWGTPDWDELDFQSVLAEKQGNEIRCKVFSLSQDQLRQSEHELWIKPKLSRTLFKVVDQHSDFSIIECELITGRRHQIRAQLAGLGHPIVGDKIYSFDGYYYLKRFQQPLNEQDYQKLGARQHCLSAEKITLNLPGGEVEICRDGKEAF